MTEYYLSIECDLAVVKRFVATNINYIQIWVLKENVMAHTCTLSLLYRKYGVYFVEIKVVTLNTYIEKYILLLLS